MALPPGWPTIADLRTLGEVEAGGSATATGLLRAALAGDLDIYLLPDFQEWDLNEVHVYSSPPARDEQPSHVVETLDLDFPAPLDRATISSLLGSGTAVVRTVRSPWELGYLTRRLQPLQLEAGGTAVSRADLARYLADRGAQGDSRGVGPMVEAPTVPSETKPLSQADLARYLADRGAQGDSRGVGPMVEAPTVPSETDPLPQADPARDVGGQDAQEDSRRADPMVEEPAALDETGPLSRAKAAAAGRRAWRRWVVVGAVALLAVKFKWAKVGDHTKRDLEILAGRLADDKVGRTPEKWLETILLGEWALATYRGQPPKAPRGNHEATPFDVSRLPEGAAFLPIRDGQGGENPAGALAGRLELDPGQQLLDDLRAYAKKRKDTRKDTRKDAELWQCIAAMLQDRVVAYGVPGAKAHASGTVREWIFGRGGQVPAQGVRTRAR